MEFVNAKCEHIAIENPIGCMSRLYRKPDQIYQPYFFGSPDRKATCIWLKNLEPLKPTNIVEPTGIYYYTAKNGKVKSDSWKRSTGFKQGDRSNHRSKTPVGVGEAMAEQWGNQIMRG